MTTAISMYSASIPGFIRALHGLAHVLRLGEAHAKTQDIDPDSLLQLRLIEDMYPLLRQVQIATDMAKNGASRLAGIEPPAFPDEEATLAQLQARIERALAHLQSIRPEQVDGSESRSITIKVGGEPTAFTGHDYLLGFVLPNLYFHVTTAYGLLRQAGVPLGKPDFFGGGKP